MSIEISDCLKREQDTCVKTIPSQNTAFRYTPALTASTGHSNIHTKTERSNKLNLWKDYKFHVLCFICTTDADLNWLKRDQCQRALFLSISNTDAMRGCQVTSFVSNLLNKRHLLSAAFAYMKTSQFGLQLLKGVSYATFQFIEVIILWTLQRHAFSGNIFNYMYQFHLYTKPERIFGPVSVKQGKLATSAQKQATID